MKRSRAGGAWSSALRALNRRPYASGELRALLQRRGYPDAEIGATLLRLADSGLLDDRAFAAGFATSRALRRHWGPARIAVALRERGLEPALIEAALDQLRQQVDARRLIEELVRKRGGPPADPRAYRRLWQLALRRGFRAEQVREVLGAVPEAPSGRRGATLALLLALGLAGSVQADIYQVTGTTHAFTNIPSREANTVIRSRSGPPRRTAAREPHAMLGELIETTATRTGVDAALLSAVIEAESAFNPDAVSPKGARGLMQLMPATADRLGVSQIHDPEQNLDGGARYLRYLIDLFGGDLRLALAAYNAGENLVQRLGRVPRIAETQGYVTRILERYGSDSHAFRTRPPDAAPVRRSRIFVTQDQRGVWYLTSAPVSTLSGR